MYTLKPLDNGHFGLVNFDVILLLYGGCPLSEIKFYCHGSVETTERDIYRDVI